MYKQNNLTLSKTGQQLPLGAFYLPSVETESCRSNSSVSDLFRYLEPLFWEITYITNYQMIKDHTINNLYSLFYTLQNKVFVLLVFLFALVDSRMDLTRVAKYKEENRSKKQER